jgi:hypothetical protein
MATFFHTYKAISFFALVNLGAIIGFVFIEKHIDKTAVAMSDYSIELDRALYTQEHSRSLASAFINSKKDRERLTEHFIGVNAVVDYLESIENLARRFGVALKVDSIGVEDLPVKSASMEYLFLNITARGEWDAITGFLAILETGTHAGFFKTLELEFLPETDSTWYMKASFGTLKLKDIDV